MNKQTTTNTSKWSKFLHLFKRQEIPAKTILLQEGHISRTMFFVEKGCLRTWVNNDGKEITTQFFFEGDKVASIESFRTNQPSLYSIESLEPCICRQFRNKTFKIFWRTFPKSKRKCRNIYSDGFCNLKKLFIPILKTILNNATKSLSKNIRILSSVFLNIISHPI